jgi:hypothetical protein
VPPRKAIDPTGIYHVGSRGTYGRPLFRTTAEHELFLDLYGRAAAKYEWVTLTWALVWNHHHLLMRLTNGGLSEGMRELHTGFSRRIHTLYGLTGQGHLIRHAFFARQVVDDRDLWEQCRYVDLNATTARARGRPDAEPWSGVYANLGLEHPRPFHAAAELLQLFGPTPAIARANYRQFLEDGLVLRGLVPSPNNGH